jgi:N-acetylneuraminic acid mutarotase
MKGRAALAAGLLAVVSAACADTSPAPQPAPDGPAWRRLADAPTERTEVAATLADGRIVVVGGFAEPGPTVDVVEVYDIEDGTWSTGPPLPHAVNHAMAAAVDGEVYVFGGYTADGPPTARAFVLRDDRWQEIAAMPEPRAAGGAAVAGERVYVVGGVGPTGVATTTMVLDPAADSWTTAPGLGRPREHLGVAAVAGSVYAVGGRAGSLEGFADLEAYAPGGAWRTLVLMPTPRGGMAAAGTDNGFVVAMGGEEEGGTFEEAEAFDVAAGRWVTLPPLPTPRHGLGAVADGTTVYAIAGGPEPGLHFSGALEAIDLASLG